MSGVARSRRWHAGLVGATVAGAVLGAVLTYAPSALGEPDTSTEQQPAENQQEEAKQQKSNPVPRLNPPNNPSNNEGNKKGDLADVHCWMYSTGPEWFPPGAMPRPAGPGERPEPCYSVAGLTPHL